MGLSMGKSEKSVYLIDIANILADGVSAWNQFALVRRGLIFPIFSRLKQAQQFAIVRSCTPRSGSYVWDR
jgi:hypothetical protein